MTKRLMHLRRRSILRTAKWLVLFQLAILTWDPSPESDLYYYVLYKCHSPFLKSVRFVIPTFFVETAPLYEEGMYCLTAVDRSGNESKCSYTYYERRDDG